MIRKLYTTIMMLTAALLLSTCAERDDWMAGSEVPDGYVALEFAADIPVMSQVQTRLVDPDGGGINTMVLFCFDAYGIFITTVNATVEGNPDDYNRSGKFKATIPDNIRRIHFVANQNISQFDNDVFIGKTETEVMSILEGTSGRMIYWACFACDEDNKDNEGKEKSIVVQMKEELPPDDTTGNPVLMFIRNHAMITLNTPDDAIDGDDEFMTGGGFIPSGFMVANTYAFGTVAPYHPQQGYYFRWASLINGLGLNFVTLPADRTKETGITEVTSDMHRYVYESDNTLDNPLSVIIRGRHQGETEELYYRVALVDEQGEMMPVVRNTNYIINIVGKLSYGQTTFDAALTAAATNNVWVAVTDDIKEIQNSTYALGVAETAYTFDAPTTYREIKEIRYTLKAVGNTPVYESDRPEVSWVGDYPVGDIDSHEFKVENGVGQGVIRVSLNTLAENDRLEGTLLIRKGVLQRKVHITAIKKMELEHVWVGTDIYGNIKDEYVSKTAANVTVMFVIPEDCPKDLFPMEVKISVKDLDVRASSGESLSVRHKGDKDYGVNEYEYESDGTAAKFSPNFKFIYIAEKPGVQRVYFTNILNHFTTTTTTTTGTMAVEAPFFDYAVRNYKFTNPNNYNTISMPTLKGYQFDGGAAKDEPIRYLLVPPKVNARVELDMALSDYNAAGNNNKGEYVAVNAGANDEFCLYSEFLKPLDDDAKMECKFYPEESEVFYNENPTVHLGGRFLLFMANSASPAGGTGVYKMVMYTTAADCNEPVRIASTPLGLPSVLSENADANGIYKGRSYRSTTFELATYNPFRFAATMKNEAGDVYGNKSEDKVVDDNGRPGTRPKVNQDGDYEIVNGQVVTENITLYNDTIKEKVTTAKLSYELGQKVELSFDVTSFQGTDDNSANPFGTEFEIYIDAPMLTLGVGDNPNLPSSKFYYDEAKKLFVYKVDESRDTERTFFNGSEVVRKDPTADVNQAGERKTLVFRTGRLVTEGDVVLSSNDKQVLFFSKTFRIENTPIDGSIRYNDGTSEKAVSASQFVAFEIVARGTRIGQVTMTGTGTYQLRLRKEYADYEWDTEPVAFRANIDKVVYTAATYIETVEGVETVKPFTIKYLMENPNVVLTPETTGGN